MGKSKSKKQKQKGKKDNAGLSCPPSHGHTQKKSIRVQLRELGLYVHDIAADGHCLFRSLWDQLNGTAQIEDHRQLRSVIMNHVEENKEFFSLFIEDDEHFDDYIKRMRGDGWGGNLEMHACSVLFECNIRVYQDGMPSWTIQNFPEESRMMLHLSYHDGNHYNSVRESLTGHPASQRGISISDSDARPCPSDVLSSSRTASTIKEDVKEQEAHAIVRVLLHVVDDSPKVQVTFVLRKNKTKKGSKTKDEGSGDHSVSSRDMCPCGSKKKYKKCCKKRHARCKLQNTAKASEQDTSDLMCSNIYV